MTFADDADIRVPMVMRGPGVPVGQHIEAIALNNDFAPIAGVPTPPSFVDGRSFLPLSSNPNRPWHRSFLIQRRELENSRDDRCGALRRDPDGGEDFR